MNKQELLSALRQVADGRLSPEEMLGKLKAAPFENIGVANINFPANRPRTAIWPSAYRWRKFE